ncbi:hypothetical protein LEP1GSC052_3011 [Leptospira kmetyi serovar Malaysia str. Bejo-Iso9]|nr:hypothetical protein LEP1GSC052_3011 [Leptospira kmetyi serovar Malaysia str. Bejo-Iso9]
MLILGCIGSDDSLRKNFEKKNFSEIERDRNYLFKPYRALTT